MRACQASLSKILATGLCALGFLGLSASGAEPKKTPVYEAPAPLSLSDGSSIRLTETAVERWAGDRVLWASPADRPAMPLLFGGPGPVSAR